MYTNSAEVLRQSLCAFISLIILTHFKPVDGKMRGWDPVQNENDQVSRKKYGKMKTVVGRVYLYGNSRFCQG